MLQYLLHARDEDDLQVIADLLGDVHQVLAVALRQEDLLEPRPVGRQDLLLDPAHGHHQAAQRDLAGHGDVVPDTSLGELRDQRHHHGDARRGTVLTDGPGRHVDVEVRLGEEVRLQPQGLGLGPGEGQRGLG